MESKEIAKVEEGPTGEALEKLLLHGDLSKLTEKQKAEYLFNYSKQLGLNPLSRPFDIIPLNGKATLYANKAAAAQLRQLKGISVTPTYVGPLRLGDAVLNDIYTVEVKAEDKEGRVSFNVGAVSIKGLGGEVLANAIMRCYTKATRRIILDHAGLGMPDESEIQDVPGVKEIQVR